MGSLAFPSPQQGFLQTPRLHLQLYLPLAQARLRQQVPLQAMREPQVMMVSRTLRRLPQSLVQSLGDLPLLEFCTKGGDG